MDIQWYLLLTIILFCVSLMTKLAFFQMLLCCWYIFAISSSFLFKLFLFFVFSYY